jgi:hypothetical protein
MQRQWSGEIIRNTGYHHKILENPGEDSMGECAKAKSTAHSEGGIR